MDSETQNISDTQAESAPLPRRVIIDRERFRVNIERARLFRQLCPRGDWERRYECRIGIRLGQFWQRTPDAKPRSYFADIMDFRMRACYVADMFVHRHNLPRPSRALCMRCNLHGFRNVTRKGDQAWQDRQRLVLELMRDGGAFIGKAPRREGQPRFVRPSDYVSCAIAEKYHTPDTEEEARRLAQAFCDNVRSEMQYIDGELGGWPRYGETQSQTLGDVEAPSSPGPSQPQPEEEQSL
ncbi:hypothetical protein B0T16DRAFT_513246 [Cercophora newfieldiana]|uniref:Uncharacterized protein n=1 Tax=Cercophora newfieldiana TaxID=92897 RepID=A0AA39Y197_9PEZI|nr:hypothetical protein B0T16DRAFT_513246 [Cercophora newfieldiana]